MPWELKTALGEDVIRLGRHRLNVIRRVENVFKPQPKTSFAKVAVLEASPYMRNQLLRETDWASIAH